MMTASDRWVRSSEGRKCADTAESEMRIGVTMQWMTQRAEVQTPRRSAGIARSRRVITEDGAGEC